MLGLAVVLIFASELGFGLYDVLYRLSWAVSIVRDEIEHPVDIQTVLKYFFTLVRILLVENQVKYYLGHL